MAQDWKTITRDRVEWFEQAVENTIENKEQLAPTGLHKGRTPLVRRFEAANLLKYLEENDVEATKLVRRFESSDAKFDRFRSEQGDDYIDELYSELQYLVGKYPSLICHFMELEPIRLELTNHLDIRDALEVLLIELEGIVDIQEEQTRVDVLDEVLECKYDESLREILKLVEAEKTPTIELPYLPSRFWWRHPSEHERWWESIKDMSENQDGVEYDSR